MVEYFVDLCAFCKQGVLKTDMDYQKGKVFHSHCFTAHGKEFSTPDSELAQLSAKTRIELVQLKNMKMRSEAQKQTPTPEEEKTEEKASKKAKTRSRVKKAKQKGKQKGKAKKKSGRHR